MLGQPYDYDSVMHYSAYAFAIDRSKPTIVPKQSGAQIGQRTHLSTIDIREIQLLYGCTTDPHATNPPINSVTTKVPISSFTSAPVAGSKYTYADVTHFPKYHLPNNAILMTLRKKDFEIFLKN